MAGVGRPDQPGARFAAARCKRSRDIRGAIDPGVGLIRALSVFLSSDPCLANRTSPVLAAARSITVQHHCATSVASFVHADECNNSAMRNNCGKLFHPHTHNYHNYSPLLPRRRRCFCLLACGLLRQRACSRRQSDHPLINHARDG